MSSVHERYPRGKWAGEAYYSLVRHRGGPLTAEEILLDVETTSEYKPMSWGDRSALGTLKSCLRRHARNESSAFASIGKYYFLREVLSPDMLAQARESVLNDPTRRGRHRMQDKKSHSKQKRRRSQSSDRTRLGDTHVDADLDSGDEDESDEGDHEDEDEGYYFPPSDMYLEKDHEETKDLSDAYYYAPMGHEEGKISMAGESRTHYIDSSSKAHEQREIHEFAFQPGVSDEWGSQSTVSEKDKQHLLSDLASSIDMQEQERTTAAIAAAAAAAVAAKHQSSHSLAYQSIEDPGRIKNDNSSSIRSAREESGYSMLHLADPSDTPGFCQLFLPPTTCSSDAEKCIIASYSFAEPSTSQLRSSTISPPVKKRRKKCSITSELLGSGASKNALPFASTTSSKINTSLPLSASARAIFSENVTPTSTPLDRHGRRRVNSFFSESEFQIEDEEDEEDWTLMEENESDFLVEYSGWPEDVEMGILEPLSNLSIVIVRGAFSDFAEKLTWQSLVDMLGSTKVDVFELEDGHVTDELSVRFDEFVDYVSRASSYFKRKAPPYLTECVFPSSRWTRNYSRASSSLSGMVDEDSTTPTSPIPSSDTLKQSSSINSRSFLPNSPPKHSISIPSVTSFSPPPSALLMSPPPPDTRWKRRSLRELDGKGFRDSTHGLRIDMAQIKDGNGSSVATSIPLSPASHVGANILFDLSSSKEAKLSGSRSSSLASSLQGRTESSRYPLQFQPSAFDEGAPSTLSYSSLLSHELTSTGVAPISSRPELVRSPHGLEELQKVKKRKEERAIERELWEQEKMRLAREREAADYADWESKEEEFHLEQLRNRSEIRLLEKRPIPIDYLFNNILLIEKPHLDLSAEIRDPFEIFEGLSVEELEECLKEIGQHLELHDTNHEYWSCLGTCCQDKINQRRREEEELSHARDTNATYIPVVRIMMDEVGQVFHGKSYDELILLEREVHSKIKSANEGEEGIDVEYWENISKNLEMYKARAKLREIHQRFLSAVFEIIKKRREDEISQMEEDRRYFLEEPESDEEVVQEKSEMARFVSSELHPAAQTDRKRFSNADRFLEKSDRRSAVPQKIIPNPKRRLELPEDVRAVLTEEELMTQEAARPMETGEAKFSDEVVVEDQPYSMFDKFRPRKPRYFNRVHTRFDWNKYNSTHYDHDNPPPKTVVGYKFNIFYPDLIDKTATPTFQLLPADTSDTCIIRFHAGPPYEDVAFKIANKEWNMAHRRGYRCTFHDGVLQLHFNFKRYWYRR